MKGVKERDNNADTLRRSISRSVSLPSLALSPSHSSLILSPSLCSFHTHTHRLLTRTCYQETNGRSVLLRRVGEGACVDGEERHVCLCRLLKVNPFRRGAATSIFFSFFFFERVVELQPSFSPPAPRPLFLLCQFIRLSIWDEFQQWHG